MTCPSMECPTVQREAAGSTKVHLGSHGIAISLNPSSGQGQRQKPDMGLSEKLRCSGWEICLEIDTCRQGIIHGACFSPSYPGKSVLIALGHQCRLGHALCCTGKQDFHSYSCSHLPGCGRR